MDHFETLALGTENFESLLPHVSESDFARATPCENWSIMELVWHVARASDMSVLLLSGGTKEEAVKMFDVSVPPDVLEQCRRALDAQLNSFASAGDLDGVVHHPLGDVTVAQLFDFRIMDLTVHFWDLARALGVDEEIPGALVAYVYAQLQPLEDVVGQIGIFGEGPSRTLEENAPTQLKLLDLTGRRP
jgi:uncharacterized protein (TIGR03086 family)